MRSQSFDCMQIIHKKCAQLTIINTHSLSTHTLAQQSHSPQYTLPKLTRHTHAVSTFSTPQTIQILTPHTLHILHTHSPHLPQTLHSHTTHYTPHTHRLHHRTHFTVRPWTAVFKGGGGRPSWQLWMRTSTSYRSEPSYLHQQHHTQHTTQHTTPHTTHNTYAASGVQQHGTT